MPIGIKKQLALVKAYKRQASTPPKQAVRTSFSRKRNESAVVRGRGNDEKIDVSGVDWTALPTLFVDGYNVVNAWPRLKKRFAKGDLSGARDLLLADVADYVIRRFNATVVFDANGAYEQMGKDKHEDYAGGLVAVAYAHDSADAYIERETRKLRAEGVDVHVASSDNGIGTACRLYGATVVSSNWMITELKASRNAAAAVLEDFNTRQQRLSGRDATFFDALDPATRAQWDAQIKESAAAKVPRKQREAMQAIEQSGGAVEFGAAARMRKRMAEQAARRRTRRPSDGDDAAAGAAADSSDGEEEELPPDT